eukprot:EG_transcript_42615
MAWNKAEEQGLGWNMWGGVREARVNKLAIWLGFEFQNDRIDRRGGRCRRSGHAPVQRDREELLQSCCMTQEQHIPVATSQLARGVVGHRAKKSLGQPETGGPDPLGGTRRALPGG